ncbi:hypothetical protein [Sinimarinibacterium flocculans]|uniref:hypothetical protein n=1 Tax=Sinimarinibacterium flocculans TaxID=985250 RepID=UPI002493839B|nr:hypothetical protein [Sinimarinibacterium flocculans]
MTDTVETNKPEIIGNGAVHHYAIWSEKIKAWEVCRRGDPSEVVAFGVDEDEAQQLVALLERTAEHFAAKQHTQSSPETPGLREAIHTAQMRLDVLAASMSRQDLRRETISIAKDLAAALDTPPNREGVVLVPIPRDVAERVDGSASHLLWIGEVATAITQALGESGGEQ